VWRIGQEAVLWRRRVGRSSLRLSLAERERIFVGIAGGESDSEIARALGRHRSTVGREIRRCAGRRSGYRPLRAEALAVQREARPKQRKLERSARLLAAVEGGLREQWSPGQISARLKREFPDDVEMRISHETIYQSLYVQSRGELRRELTAQLRTRRRRRKPQGRSERRGRIKDMVLIADRPPEVDERRVPGHWEGDLLVGAGNKSAVVTLVERHTRYVMLAKLEDQTTVHVTDVLAQRIRGLPDHLVRSLTWDQGRELAAHKRFTEKTAIQVYFLAIAPPASPSPDASTRFVTPHADFDPRPRPYCPTENSASRSWRE
jgi:IS30 family transposase